MIQEGEVLQLLRKAVDEKGLDHVGMNSTDEGCQYFEDGQPSCIIGHVFSYMGLRQELMGTENTVPIIGPTYADQLEMHPRLATQLRLAGIPDFTQQALRLMSLAQSEQDHGTPWGQVVDMVETYASQYLATLSL